MWFHIRNIKYRSNYEYFIRRSRDPPEKMANEPAEVATPRLKITVLRPRLVRKPDLLSHVGQKASVVKKIKCGLAFFLLLPLIVARFIFITIKLTFLTTS